MFNFLIIEAWLTVDSEVRLLDGRRVRGHLTLVHAVVPVGDIDYLKPPVVRISEAQRYPLVGAVHLTADGQQLDVVGFPMNPRHLQKNSNWVKY